MGKPDKGAPHRWADCDMCGRIVICGKCGNNCCNGGHGEMAPGIECDACPEAYAAQEAGESGFFRTLTLEQQAAALAYGGLEGHGDRAFLFAKPT